MTKTKRSVAVEVANDALEADGVASTSRVLTPVLTPEQAEVLTAYCKKYGAARGPAVLVRAIDAMRADLGAQQRDAA